MDVIKRIENADMNPPVPTPVMPAAIAAMGNIGNKNSMVCKIDCGRKY